MNKAIKAAGTLLLIGSILAGCTIDKRDKEATEQASQTETGAAAPSATAAQPATGTLTAVPWLATKNTTRIQTSDPVEAAILVSRTLWPALSEASRTASVVLTDPANWQIAAVSADLIHHPSNGPVLFLTKDEVPSATLAELKRLNPLGAEGNRGIQVVIVGDVGENVIHQLTEAGWKTDAIPGSDPAQVAQAVDAYYAKVAGEMPEGVIIGSSEEADYTLPAVNWIAHMPEPLLYVAKDEIPAATAEALKNRNGKAQLYVLGQSTVISDKVVNELKNYGTVTRIAGKNPYENAVAFAAFKDQATDFGWGITTPGHNFSFVAKGQAALAIAAASFSHLGKHAPLLLTDKTGMPAPVMEYVMSLQPKFKDSPAEGPYNHAWLTGDAAAISVKAQDEIDQMLEIASDNGANPHSGH
ncbi:cell wall-binding repeat-containing protein [Gorillibacterium timonense]|uniref:cell wall-binding repeat-containing protein n=1 Tax=Gorillibacterium timonense TaxID=1689269 RepID=UPI00071DBDC4|nr:cell wall-binding repeat-containing protein [Gorillibacterium timonense]